MPISSCIVIITNGKITIRVANEKPIKIYADSRLGIVMEYSLLEQNLEEVKQYAPLVVKSQDIKFQLNQELTQLINRYPSAFAKNEHDIGQCNLTKHHIILKNE